VTEENQRRNALEELVRADTCFTEARALHDAELPYGAASRAYYAVFHASRALLFSIGIEVKTHKRLVSLIGEHFVRPGRLSSVTARLVSRMQRDREDADYATGAVFTGEDASQMIADADAFVSEVKQLIA
jgi:uncharacterized protein (UPF0332 family)